MKVVGTGSPQVLTIRFCCCELDGLRSALSRRRAEVTEAAAAAYKQPATATATANTAVEDKHEELVELSRVLNQLDLADIADGDDIELIGPNWLWVRVIRDASGAAVDQFADAIERFRDPQRLGVPDALRAAAEAAHAWTNTLLDYHHVDNHGMDRWQ